MLGNVFEYNLPGAYQLKAVVFKNEMTNFECNYKFY